MSDDDPESLDTSSAFSFTGEVPPFFTRSYHRPFSTFSTETPAAIPPSTPSLFTSFDDTPLPTPTPTPDDSTLTDAFSSSTGTLDTSTPTSDDQDPPPSTSTDFDSSAPEPTDSSSSSDIPLDSTTAIDPSASDGSSDTSSPTSVISFSTFSSSDDPFSTFSSIPSGLPLTTDSSSPSSSIFTTSGSHVTTSSPSSTPSRTPSTSVPVPTPPPTSTSSWPTSSWPTPFSQLSSSSASSVTTAPFPSFGGSTQSRTSTSNTGAIVAATTGSVALAIILALLAILCKKRQMKRARVRAAAGPFRDLDLDSELLAANQPLIIGDGPAGGAVYTDPFTDESQSRTRSRTVSVTTGPTPSLARSGNSFQAVTGAMPIHDLRDGQAAGNYNQRRSADQNSPPQFPSAGIVRNRSYQSLAPVHTQLMPEPPVPRQSSPSFDAGAVAYIRNNDRTPVHSPPSPGPFSAGNAEGNRLTSAFSAASGLSPQHSSPAPPPNIDEMWRSTPDPIAASSSYRPSINRRQSLTPSVGGHIFEPGDSAVIAPMNASAQGTTRPFTDSEPDAWNPYTQVGNFGSRPSPIPEVSEIHTHSQEGSNNSGGTWNSTRSVYSTISSPVVMQAQRVQLTPTVLSLVSPPTPSSGGSHGESLPSYGTASNLPPLPPVPAPPLPEVQPLSLGKKRSVQGTS